MSRKSTQLSVRAAYGRLWRDWVHPYRRAFVVIAALMIVMAASSAGYSKLIQTVIAALEQSSATVMFWGPAGVIGLTLIKTGAQYAYVRHSNKVMRRVELDLQKRMFRDLVGADLSRLSHEAPSSLAARFSADISLVGSSITQVIGGISAALVVVATFSVMLAIDWAMTLAMILIFSLVLLPVNVIGRKLRQISRGTQRQVGAMTANVTEGLAGIRMVRTYQLEEPLTKNADTVFDTLQTLRLKQANWNARMSPMMEALAGFAVASLLFLVGWRMSQGTTSLADFMALLTGLGVATSPSRRMGNVYGGIQQGFVALERIFALFDGKNDIAEAVDAQAMGRAVGALKFADVGFTYPDGNVALKGLDLEIKAGEKVAFVGRSGAGKSTIFNILPRLYDVTCGVVALDGIDIRKIRISDLRNQIAMVSQDSVLLSGTVAENIGFGRMTASRDEIVAAAKAASADEFICALPSGYDTVINPSAATFSGGERQRLSIARAILRDAPLLLLDEPTSALDAESEASIRTALDHLSAGRTTLIIAHRLATVLDADKIVVLDEGQIVDMGSHEELIARDGLYAELYRLQFAQ